MFYAKLTKVLSFLDWVGGFLNNHNKINYYCIRSCKL
jgi:hypothetical protein